MAMRPVHPGEVLAGELDELKLSASELARQIHVPANRITQILNRQRGITGDTAVRLGHWFGTSPEFWMNLQSQYDIAIAKQKLGSELSQLPQRTAA